MNAKAPGKITWACTLEGCDYKVTELVDEAGNLQLQG